MIGCGLPVGEARDLVTGRVRYNSEDDQLELRVQPESQ